MVTIGRNEILQTLEAVVKGECTAVTERLRNLGTFALDSRHVYNGKKWIGIMGADDKACASLKDLAASMRVEYIPICSIRPFEFQEEAYAHGDLLPFEILLAPLGEHYAFGNAAMMAPGVYKEIKG